MSDSIAKENDIIEFYYLIMFMSYDQVAAATGLTQYRVKNYLSKKGLSRKNSTTKAVKKLKQQHPSTHVSSHDLHELREARLTTMALKLMSGHKRLEDYQCQ